MSNLIPIFLLLFALFFYPSLKLIFFQFHSSTFKFLEIELRAFFFTLYSIGLSLTRVYSIFKFFFKFLLLTLIYLVIELYSFIQLAFIKVTVIS